MNKLSSEQRARAPGEFPRRAGSGRRHLFGFVLAGGTGFAVDAGVLTLGIWLGLPAAIARIPSFVAAVVTTWIMNRSITFKTRQGPNLSEFLRYLIAMSFGLAINFAIFMTMLGNIPSFADRPVLALVPATLAGMGANFLTSRQLLHR